VREGVGVRSYREISSCHRSVESLAKEHVAFCALGCELAAEPTVAKGERATGPESESMRSVAPP
jgi:hypothetical protein